MINPLIPIQQKALKGISSYVSNLRLFSLNARLFLIGTFFMGMGFSGFWLLFNLYLKSLGFSEGKIGNIISASTIGMVIMAIPASIIIRRHSIRRILLFATPIAMFSYLVQATSVNYFVIIGGGLTAGLSSVFF